MFVANGPGPVTGPDTQFFVAARKDYVLVAFRGSEPNLADWITDAKYSLTPTRHGMVHSGFLEALDEAWNDLHLREKLSELAAESPGRPIWFTGHSLGAACAVLAATRWFDEHPKGSGGVYMFGAPRVGDVVFSAAIEIPVWRIMDRSDAITLLPGSDYAEVGGMKWINQKGEFEDTRGPIRSGFFRNTEFFASKLMRGQWVWLPPDLIDHSPLYYAIDTFNQSQRLNRRDAKDAKN